MNSLIYWEGRGGSQDRKVPSLEDQGYSANVHCRERMYIKGLIAEYKILL